MPPSRRPFGSTLALRMLPALTGAFSACTNASDEAAPTELAAVDADHITYEVRRNISREGIREALLRADSMFMWNDSTHAKIAGLTLLIFDERGMRRAEITADSGRLSQPTDELWASGNAILVIPEQDREIRSKELIFAPSADRIWTDSAVVVKEGGCTVEGDRFQADMSFENVTIWGTRETGSQGSGCASR